MNITQDFKYVVYEDGLATQLKSGYFNIQPEDINYPLLEDEDGNSNYKLYVKFPNEKKNLLSGMMKILILSLLFLLSLLILLMFAIFSARSAEGRSIAKC